MIDRNYNKVILLCYPAGAGGNFLINCLSLSDQCVLRNSLLAEKQLHTGYSIEQKLDYFHSQLQKSLDTMKWNDLNLGCGNLFGIDNNAYLTEYPELIQRKFNYVISDLIEQQKYLFIVAHTTQYLDAYLKFWKNSRIIFLTDYHDFVTNRGVNPKVRGALINYWQAVKGESWPNNPPLTDVEFKNLTPEIQQELIENFHSEIFRWIETSPTKTELHDTTVRTYIKKFNGYNWNVKKTYFGDETGLLKELHKCAKWAGITLEAPDSAVIDYYQKWLSTIFAIKDFNRVSGPT